LPALDHPIDICKHSFSQFCRLEYVGTGAKAKNNETGVIFIFELGTHRDPSVGVALCGADPRKPPHVFIISAVRGSNPSIALYRIRSRNSAVDAFK
jgi:hypothetical protein